MQKTEQRNIKHYIVVVKSCITYSHINYVNELNANAGLGIQWIVKVMSKQNHHNMDVFVNLIKSQTVGLQNLKSN